MWEKYSFRFVIENQKYFSCRFCLSILVFYCRKFLVFLVFLKNFFGWHIYGLKLLFWWTKRINFEFGRQCSGFFFGRGRSKWFGNFIRFLWNNSTENSLQFSIQTLNLRQSVPQIFLPNCYERRLVSTYASIATCHIWQISSNIHFL